MKKLYYARHGESTINANRIWGARTHAPLTELGEKQARAEGKKAKELNLKFDLIISSPLRRAEQTAEIIADEVDYPKDKIVLEDLLMERAVGELEGSGFDDFFAKNEYKDLDKVKDAETIEDLQKRAEQAYKILSTRPEESILVVSHSAFGRALRRVIEKQPWMHEYTEHTSIPHAEITCWVEEA